MTETSGRGGGSALAVDLRRARAARRREERAEERAAQPPAEPLARRRPRRLVECAGREPIDCVREWFTRHEWKPFAFQEEVWRSYLDGESGLIHAATGTGKTYAAWMGPLLEWLRDYPAAARQPAAPLTVLWITPLRALAGDTEVALRAPVEDLGIPWAVESRTGDTSARIRARQRERLPSALVTTPESLSLLLTRDDAPALFEHLQLVVVDEWHELMASKRGVQTELCLARLRRFRPRLRTLGLSATLGNLDTARDALLGVDARARPRPGRIFQGLIPKALEVDALIPETMERFPWSGQIGLRLLPEVIGAVEEGETSLVFTNTRATAEIWFQALLAARPDWAGILALHHGSMDRGSREWVEDGLREGRLRCVVCTSTLDLGVDFTPVDRVLQVGSPKSVGRLIQRAGRSGHRPGAVSRLTCVPTNALELVDVAAARAALEAREIEARRPVERPLDLLAQHAVTVALGGGYRSDDLRSEVRTAWAYRDLRDDEWRWVLDFITRGGNALQSYPEYSKVVERDGRYEVTSKMAAMRHRLSIGTIVSEAAMKVQFLRGRTIGMVEENFIGRLRPGDVFTFAGRVLEFVRVRGMVAQVCRSTAKSTAVPHWSGARMPISPQLAARIRAKLDEARRGLYLGREMAAVRGILELQATWSRLPAADELLIERVRTREGHHVFLYPVEGRLVHEGLAALFAYRIAQLGPISFTLAANDYGLELLSPERAPLDEAIEAGLLSPEHLLQLPLHHLAVRLEQKEVVGVVARRLVVLGDLFHAKAGRIATRTLAALRDWRERCAKLEIQLVRGNHDRHAGDPPEDLRINCVNSPAFLPPFVLRHEPRESAEGYTLAGHVHPALVVNGPALGRERLPCFLVRPRLTILPAFGSFTGTASVIPDPADRGFVVADGEVLPIG